MNRIQIHMEHNGDLIIGGMSRFRTVGCGWWDDLSGDNGPGEYSPEQRRRFEATAYRIMKRDHIKVPPKSINGRTVKLEGETFSERWLVHYYNLRHFQPCREVASFVANRMTGEYHRGDQLSFEEDLARLCAASKILALSKTKGPRKPKKGQKQ